jgi:serine/threonine-protein kinase
VNLAGRTLLGKYRIESLLGQGGMGRVWQGSHVVTGRSVAIKVLDERFIDNAQIIHRFGREARAASAIAHEGIVEVLDLDRTEDGLPFLVMELLTGEPLSQRIERLGRLPQDDVARIGSMLLDALDAAHEHGVVHRDLKPDNIYLAPAGRRGEIVKILDFGISSKADDAGPKLTITGSVLGTPHYMSPEQAMGDTDLDSRVDIYGAGVVLYECLVGDVPFDGPNYNKLLRVILDDEPTPPSQRGAEVESAFEAAILQALSKDREHRPRTARMFRDRLMEAHGKPIFRSEPPNETVPNSSRRPPISAPSQWKHTENRRSSPLPPRQIEPRSAPLANPPTEPKTREAFATPTANATPATSSVWSELPVETRRWLVRAAIAVMAFVILVVAVRVVVQPGAPPTESFSEPTLDHEPGTTPGSEWILIEVVGLPANAQLRLDGLPGATLPLRLRRGGTHVLEIHADGYEGRLIRFEADAPRQLRGDLRPAIGTVRRVP